MLLWLDSFDDRTADFGDRYDSVGASMNSVPGRTGKGVQFPSTSFPFGHTSWLRKNVPAYPTYIVGVAVKTTTIIYQATRIIEFFDGTDLQMYVQLNLDFTLSVYRGDDALLGGPTTRTVPSAAFVYVEFKVTVDSTIGAYTLKMNGNVVASGTGINTQNTADPQITVIGLYNEPIDSSAALTFDDFYICDDQGAQNNSFLGPIKIPCLRPNGAGNTTEWEIGGGSPAATNHESVDDATPDDDVTVVGSNTVDAKDLYALENLSISEGAIVGVHTVFRAKIDILGERAVAKVLRSGGTDYDGAAFDLSDDWANYSEIDELDPATSDLWEISAINALQAGIKVTA